MGFFRFLRSVGKAEGTRESFRTMYAGHLAEIARRPEILNGYECTAQDLALFLTAEIHYKSRRWPYVPLSLWQDIAPYRVMTAAEGAEACAEFVAAREGFKDARIDWLASKLRAVAEEAIAHPHLGDGLFAKDPGSGSDWQALLTEDQRSRLEMAYGDYLVAKSESRHRP